MIVIDSGVFDASNYPSVWVLEHFPGNKCLFHFIEVWLLSSVCFDVIYDMRGYSFGKVAFGAFLSQTAKEKMVKSQIDITFGGVKSLYF